MALFRGRLFAGALFAGALFGAEQGPVPPTPPSAPIASAAPYRVVVEPRVMREDEELLLLISIAIEAGALPRPS